MRELAAETHTWLAARSMLLDRCDDFYRQLVRVRENFDPEEIHDLRVASRRLREGLSLFASCFRRKKLQPLRREMKALTGMLGAIRNSDEAVAFFCKLLPEVADSAAAVVQKMAATLQAQREEQRRLLDRELGHLDPDGLQRRIGAMCNAPRLYDPRAPELFTPVGDTLLAAIAVRSAMLAELLPPALVAENVVAQHRLRIAVKRFRYRLEFLAPLASAGYRELYAVVKNYQELLGQMHDLDVFAGLAAEMIPDLSPREVVTTIISERRNSLFARFLEQHRVNPLDSMGDRVRSLL